jgi:hypothetical protein
MRSAGNFNPEWGYLAPAPSFARTARVVLVATAIGATAGAGVVLSLVDRPSEPEKTPVAARAIVPSVRAAAVPSVAPAAPAAMTAPVAMTAPAKLASPPASAAVVAPSGKPDITARASSRTTPQPRPAISPAANAAAPAPSPAASVSANTSSPNPAPPAPAVAPAASGIVPAPAATTADTGAAVTAAALATASASATALPAAAEPPKVVEAAPADAPDGTTIMAPEQAESPKKAKRHAASKKNAPFPGIGSIFRRVFASHGSRSYYPNSQ